MAAETWPYGTTRQIWFQNRNQATGVLTDVETLTLSIQVGTSAEQDFTLADNQITRVSPGLYTCFFDAPNPGIGAFSWAGSGVGFNVSTPKIQIQVQSNFSADNIAN